MTPKILHLYWGGNRSLSWLRYLTAKSFAMLNPEWEIQVHYPSESCASFGEKDWMMNLRGIRQVRFVGHSSSLWEGLEGIEDSCYREIHKSDFLRWQLLQTVGGVWSDFDIFYVRSLAKLLSKNNFDVNLIKLNYKRRDVHPIGFLTSTGKNEGQKFFSRVEAAAYKAYDPNRFQCIGRDLLDYLVNKRNGRLNYLRSVVVYPWGLQSRGFIRLYESEKMCVPKEAVGIHWFGGYDRAQMLESKLSPESLFYLSKEFRLASIIEETMESFGEV